MLALFTPTDRPRTYTWEEFGKLLYNLNSRNDVIINSKEKFDAWLEKHSTMLPDTIDVADTGITINPKASTVMPPSEEQPEQTEPKPNAMQRAAMHQAKKDIANW